MRRSTGVRISLVAVLVCAAPLARADVSVRDAGAERAERCLSDARRALARDYPNDAGDENLCTRRPGELTCRGACYDWSCHNDACTSWRTSIEVHVERTGSGRYDIRVSDDAPPAQAARVRRVLRACLP
jgi:hypothetical protein